MVGAEIGFRDGIPAWQGSVHSAPGLLAFTGRIGDAEAHAHACLQVLIITGGRVWLGDGGPIRVPVEAVAIIPAGARHQVTAHSDASGLAAYLDADSSAGRAATARLRATGGDLADPGTWIGAATSPQRPASAAPAPIRDSHPVLAEAIRHATTDPNGPPDLATLATVVSISPSRLGHLFAAYLGLPYPAWRRWVRLQRAIAATRQGANLTHAAHAAGFADSAHLARTFKAMFGLTPSRAVHAAGWRG